MILVNLGKVGGNRRWLIEGSNPNICSLFPEKKIKQISETMYHLFQENSLSLFLIPKCTVSFIITNISEQVFNNLRLSGRLVV